MTQSYNTKSKLKARAALFPRSETQIRRASRREFCIYLVAVKGHDNISKIGMTSDWNRRRKAYDGWNLSDGDGIAQCSRFIINEEFVDLGALESHCISVLSVSFPLMRGREWFLVKFDDALPILREALINTNLVFDEH